MTSSCPILLLRKLLGSWGEWLLHSQKSLRKFYYVTVGLQSFYKPFLYNRLGILPFFEVIQRSHLVQPSRIRRFLKICQLRRPLANLLNKRSIHEFWWQTGISVNLPLLSKTLLLYRSRNKWCSFPSWLVVIKGRARSSATTLLHGPGSSSHLYLGSV